MGVIFGVDVGGTTVKIGMFDKEDSLKYKCEIKTDTSDKGSFILRDICKKLQDILQENSLTPNDCDGIGIGLPGPVTNDGRILGCVNLGWGIFNIEEKLSQMFYGVKVRAGNDANLAALGEKLAGGGRGHENVLMITLGTGVGGGVIIDGKIVTGTNGAAGEIGHMPVNFHETDVCSCGKKGCLEQYASATGIVRLTKKYIGEYKESPLYGYKINGKEITAKDVMDLAKAKDELSVKVIDEAALYLGMALAASASVINPDCIVIGGGVSKAGDFLIDKVEKSFMEYAFVPCRNVIFRQAELGNDGGMYGGAGLIK
ncbi:MAG: ROK family glucokinase [Lachnospiraceae bacterium]